jgi:hypothetical protein
MSENLAYPFALALGFTGIAMDTTTSLLPPPVTEQYFEIHSMIAERVGDTASMIVDRTIRAPIEMSWTVRVMEEADDGWRQVCQASSGVFQYRPEARLPVPTSLEWWTDGQCVDLPPGPARIITTWTPQRAGLDPVTYIARVE